MSESVSAPLRRRSRVPEGPMERLGRMGWMAGELLVGGIAEQAQRTFGGTAHQGQPSVLLNEWNADRLTRRLATMRGAAMKLGQLLSLEGDDFVPPEFADALAALRQDGDAMLPEQLHSVLSEEWGSAWEQRVRDFEWEPVAAASIGQVHRARSEDGRDLALKIQFPGVARSIDADVDNLVRLARWSRLLPAGFDLGNLQREAKRQLRQEADYRTEASHLATYRELLADEPTVVIPAVHPSLTTERILAMDYLAGVPLEDLCGPDHDDRRRSEVGALLYRLLLRELLELRFVQSDPNLANYLWLPERQKVGLIDLGAAHRVPGALSDGYRRMLVASLADDRPALRDAAMEMGYVTAEDEPEQIEAVVDLIALGWEPFRAPGPYDFAKSDLSRRLREAGLHLAFELGFRRPPPAETLFVHRKLAGTFLLCQRLRAKIDLRSEAEQLLARL